MEARAAAARGLHQQLHAESHAKQLGTGSDKSGGRTAAKYSTVQSNAVTKVLIYRLACGMYGSNCLGKRRSSEQKQAGLQCGRMLTFFQALQPAPVPLAQVQPSDVGNEKEGADHTRQTAGSRDVKLALV